MFEDNARSFQIATALIASLQKELAEVSKLRGEEIDKRDARIAKLEADVALGMELLTKACDERDASLDREAKENGWLRHQLADARAVIGFYAVQEN